MPTTRERTRPTRDREVVAHGVAQTAVIVALSIGLWLVAPLLEASAFWAEHFPWAHPREPLPFFAGFLLAGAVVGTVWTGTWEGVLAARSLRALGWTILLYWLLAVVLEAPMAAGVAVLPILAGPPFAALRIARRAPEPDVRPYLAALASVLGALALIGLAVWDVGWVARFVLLPVPVVVYVLGPVLFLDAARGTHVAARRKARPEPQRPDPDPRFYLDLPPGTLLPAASGVGILLSIGTVVFLVTVVAPGVPLSGPIAWVSLTLALPAVVWTVLRRDGLVEPRHTLGPPEVHLHTARVQHLRDQDLERLDDALAHFIRTGRGRTDLAAALAGLLGGSVPHADATHLADLLGRLPRAPWRRRAREAGVAQLVGGRSLLAAVRGGGRTG